MNLTSATYFHRPLRCMQRLAFLALCASQFVYAGSFTDVTLQAGVGYQQHTLQSSPNCRHQILNQAGQPIANFCEPERMTGGAAVADIDGDGWLDLLVTRLDGTEFLFRNLHDGTFENFTVAAGLSVIGKAANGALFFDADNDSDADLYVTTTGRAGAADAGSHMLFINDGSGVFSEEAAARSASIASANARIGQSIAAGDYDLDGYTDLYVAEWRPGSIAPGTNSLSRLLRNQGATQPGYFQDVTIAANVVVDDVDNNAWVFAPAFVDLDDDSWPELALAADFSTSKLFANNQDGTFTDITTSSSIGTDENGMGSAFGDYDGDGDLDWFVTSIYDPNSTCDNTPCQWGYSGNRLYRNDGGGSFFDVTDAAGVRDGGWGWGSVFFDADNDGDLDLVMTNGVDFPSTPDDDALFNQDAIRYWENQGNGVFTEKAAAVGLTDTGSGKGLLTFDYDNDGDLDLFIANNATGGVLYRNDDSSGNNWLRVKAEGIVSNRDGWGTVIRVQAIESGPVQVRHLGASGHFLAQSENIAHFGVGSLASANIYKVEVEWPKTGRVQTCFNVSGNQLISFGEPANASEPGLLPCGTNIPAINIIGLVVLIASLSLIAIGGKRGPEKAVGNS